MTFDLNELDVTKPSKQPKAAPIDLATLDTTAAADKGFELELTHPVTKEGLGIFVSVVGRDGTAFTDYVRRASNDRLRKSAMLNKRGKDVETPTVEKIEDEAVTLLAVCTTGWRGVILHGNEMPFSIDNAKKLYSEMRWIREQVDEAISDLGNFMAA